MLSGDKEQRTDAVKQQTEYHTPAVSEATDENPAGMAIMKYPIYIVICIKAECVFVISSIS